jgi:hypothetical protein
MAVDPNSIVPGKRYITATRHVRIVLEVTNERVRFAYGGLESGGISQWRWQTRTKFANDVTLETSAGEASAPASVSAEVEKQENDEPASPDGAKSSGSRKILSKRR